ncbi:hypothetical protein GCM10022289_44890 [Pedobacter jeongneungensis]|uniref:Uncharacterized protein n=1 Tax=Pedobacter jeongneungensis TaxID=947309 RepID=A0ABP8BQ36_9SPHI
MDIIQINELQLDLNSALSAGFEISPAEVFDLKYNPDVTEAVKRTLFIGFPNNFPMAANVSPSEIADLKKRLNANLAVNILHIITCSLANFDCFVVLTVGIDVAGRGFLDGLPVLFTKLNKRILLVDIKQGPIDWAINRKGNT